MKKFSALFSIVFFLFITGCGSSDTASSDSGNEVTIQDLAFSPSTLTVAVGTTVTWTNNDSVSHTVTSGLDGDADSGLIFDSGVIASGETFSFEFTNAGTYDYHCDIHTTMTGAIVIE